MFNGEIGRHEFQGTGIREYLDSKTSASWTCSIESAAASPRMEMFVQPWNTKVKPKDHAFHSVSDIIHLWKIPFKFKNIMPDCIISPYTLYIYIYIIYTWFIFFDAHLLLRPHHHQSLQGPGSRKLHWIVDSSESLALLDKLRTNATKSKNSW